MPPRKIAPTRLPRRLGRNNHMRRQLNPLYRTAALLIPFLCGCSRASSGSASQAASAAPSPQHLGFDRNDYPGDAAMAVLHRTFAFTGYWLTPPPEATANTWFGKRKVLIRQGWGFLLLANGRLDKEILAAKKSGTSPEQLAKKDAAVAIAAAIKEDFPAHAILFLDQEEGGRLLPEQAAYLLAWTEAVSASSYRAGVYASGQPVPDGTSPDGKAQTITTIDDLRQQVRAKSLHEIAMFDAQDSCPPAPGCTVHPGKPLNASGELNLTAWQFAQSPRRPEITQACAATYAADGNCYAPGFPDLFLDLDAADSDDPSHGR
jgi:hypothetical protein